jgi:NAD(P)-dependent dehydrogenase (short-subunit alcohol dehydrogenase family)
MKNPFDLSGKKILVTGASSGLGQQTAITLSQLGAGLFLTARNQTRLEETKNQLSGVDHTIIACDLTIEKEIDELLNALPPLNGIVFSAGISQLMPAGFVKKTDLEKNFSVGFDSAVLLCSRLIRTRKLIKNDCSIVFISSISTSYPFVGGALYVSTKAALEGYSRVLAIELAPKKIRVNCVAPAFVMGPMLENTQQTTSSETIKKIEDKQPLGLGQPEDVANTIAFFLADASRWITGSRLILGGG